MPDHQERWQKKILISVWRRLTSQQVMKVISIMIVAAVLGAGFVTYLLFTNTDFLILRPRKAFLLLNIDLVLLLLLGIVIARRLVKVWVERRQGQAGAKLHVRLVMIFSILAALPAITVAFFSATFFNTGVQSWFSTRVVTALDESSAVAKAYLEEHKKVIRANVHAMAVDTAQQISSLLNNPDLFNQFLNVQIDVRNLNEAIVFNSVPHILARSRFSFALEFEPLGELDLKKAASNVIIQTNKTGDRVRALIKISPDVDAYLLVGRLVDSMVLKRIKKVEDAVGEYNQARSKLSDIELKFSLIFIVVACLLLFLAIWIGIIVATRLVRPIRNLIAAVEKVRAGDLSARVKEPKEDDEFRLLSQEFNRMTQRLEGQQQKLVEANLQLDARRQFIEDVLEGVSAGVLGLAYNKVIQITNQSAADLLGVSLEDMIGRVISEIIPEITPLLMQAEIEEGKFIQSQLNIAIQGFPRVLIVRVVVEEEKAGYIITFDDVTELVSAQRKAAWADVARRIAHEIKNPLTPIQLSAERLRRKYSMMIPSEDKNFEASINTIIRQVEHIGLMVSEFSSFARMPSPQMHMENVIELCRQAIFLQQSAHPGIRFNFVFSDAEIQFLCDASQIGQVLTNLLQNAVNAIEERKNKIDGDFFAPVIKITVEHTQDTLTLIVEDNGDGFPVEGREALTEPYVTKRIKGTGLGLAIVKKIVEDHKGSLALEDRDKGGARVRLTFYYGQ